MPVTREEKLRALSVLHMVAYSSPEPAERVGLEVLFVSGEILEGVAPENLSLRSINRDEFLKELKAHGSYLGSVSLAISSARRRSSSKRLLEGAESQQPLDEFSELVDGGDDSEGDAESNRDAES